jgi:hypothetical protein
MAVESAQEFTTRLDRVEWCGRLALDLVGVQEDGIWVLDRQELSSERRLSGAVRAADDHRLQHWSRLLVSWNRKSLQYSPELN